MILYHYDISPYSELIRLMFGHTQLPWCSHKVAPLPPRKTLDPLSGGYRRIPIAQVGADIYCDSRVICDEIAEITDRPELAYSFLKGDLLEFVQVTNSRVFMAVALSAAPGKSFSMMLRNHMPWEVVRLMKDRLGVMKQSKMPRLKSGQALEIISAWRDDVEIRLSNTQAMGGERLTYADFAVYHVLWFLRKTRRVDMPSYPATQKWFQGLKRIRHGNSTRLSRKDCWLAAAGAQVKPVTTAQDHQWLGKKVVVEPNDYARDGVVGTLASIDDKRWVLSRENEEVGHVHVHFPQQGFDINLV